MSETLVGVLGYLAVQNRRKRRVMVFSGLGSLDSFFFSFLFFSFFFWLFFPFNMWELTCSLPTVVRCRLGGLICTYPLHLLVLGQGWSLLILGFLFFFPFSFFSFLFLTLGLGVSFFWSPGSMDLVLSLVISHCVMMLRCCLTASSTCHIFT